MLSRKRKKFKKPSSTLTRQNILCAACSRVLDPWRLENSSLFIYLFKLKTLALTLGVCVYYQLQCTCHSFGWKGSQGRI